MPHYALDAGYVLGLPGVESCGEAFAAGDQLPPEKRMAAIVGSLL